MASIVGPPPAASSSPRTAGGGEGHRGRASRPRRALLGLPRAGDRHVVAHLSPTDDVGVGFRGADLISNKYSMAGRGKLSWCKCLVGVDRNLGCLPFGLFSVGYRGGMYSLSPFL